MSQSPSDTLSPTTTDETLLAGDQRPPWSFVAITGFVLSFLLPLAPLGVLLGIVGIFRTRGRRRGMGLSIASIPIGLVVSGFTTLTIFAVWMLTTLGNDASSATRGCLSISRNAVSEAAAEYYERFSPRFQVVVSSDEFEAWLTEVLTQHGALQTLRPTKTNIITKTPDGYAFSFTGEFVNGAARVLVTMGMNDMAPEIDDIEVDGLSAMKYRKPG